jgi:hypothetical protein
MIVKLRDIASVIRSKNAGPYELTLDIMFKEFDLYQKIKQAGVVNKDFIGRLYGISADRILDIIEFDPAGAIKITMIRPTVSGNVGDTDIYGAQQHAPLLDATLEIPQ